MYTVKKVIVSSRDVTNPNKTLPRLFLARESLVSDILAGDGKTITFFTV
jgi:hypothetical protein